MERYIFRNPTKTVFGEATKNSIGIVRHVHTDITEKQDKNDMRSITLKRYQRHSQPLPVIKRTFESKSEYQLAVSRGINISDRHFKVEPKTTELK